MKTAVRHFGRIGIIAVLTVVLLTGCMRFDPDIGARGFTGVQEWLGFEADEQLTETEIRDRVLELYPVGTHVETIEAEIPDALRAERVNDRLSVHDQRLTFPCALVSILSINFVIADDGRITAVLVDFTGVCV